MMQLKVILNYLGKGHDILNVNSEVKDITSASSRPGVGHVVIILIVE